MLQSNRFVWLGLKNFSVTTHKGREKLRSTVTDNCRALSVDSQVDQSLATRHVTVYVRNRGREEGPLTGVRVKEGRKVFLNSSRCGP